MKILSKFIKITFATSLMFFAGCQMTELAQNPLKVLKNPAVISPVRVSDAQAGAVGASLSNVLSLKDVISQATPDINVDVDFAKAVAEAVKSSPKVQMAKAEVLQQQAKLGVAKSQLDFRFSGTIYAGIEDVTDKTNGIAGVMSASKMIYDGGQMSSGISADKYAVQSAFESYKAALDEQALDISVAWVELERYQSLNILISDRLAVLDPLIKQLELIAAAGVSDATQVAAAQRTVAMIRVAQTDVEEHLAQAELNFIRLLGDLPNQPMFDAKGVAKSVPRQVNLDLAMAAPGLLANYASYLSALERLEAAKARNSLSVAFETKVQRPFGQSQYDSDESVGLVVQKTFYDGGKIASEILAAQSAVDRQVSSVRGAYRRGRHAVESSMQSISSMDHAIDMSRSNAQALREEIALLRKQLVIGQSTLDSVLSVEARLYDAESKEIHFTSDKYRSQLSVLSAIGRLSSIFGVKPAAELK